MLHHFSTHFLSILLILLLVLNFCTSKPINRLINIAEKQRIEQMIEEETKNIAILEEKEQVLMYVVDALEDKIKKGTVRLEQLKSLSPNGGRKQIVENFLEDYRKVFGSNNSQFRPG